MPVAVCYGEALIDLVATRRGVPLAEAPAFAPYPGGAPANWAVGLARLGVATAFIGRVGDDAFGHHLAGVLAREGVEVAWLGFDAEARTPLAFVAVGPDGQPEYLFYHRGSATYRVQPGDVPDHALSGARVFLFGSVGIAEEPARGTAFDLARRARARGTLVVFDPNLRLSWFQSEAAAREALRSACALADVIKLSAAELEFLGGDLSRGLPRDLPAPHLQVAVVTRGELGAIAFRDGERVEVPAYRVRVADTVGAGDSFLAALAAALAAEGAPPPRQVDLAHLLQRAAAAAALTCTRHGAIPALPTRAELERFLKRTGRGRDAAWC